MLKTTRCLTISLSKTHPAPSRVIFHRFCWLVFVGCVLLNATLWNIAKASIHRTENFLQRLSSAEGLSHNRAFKTLQDNKGYIWIATEIGLNRYDGYQVQQIPGPDNVFSSEYISTLFLDNDGFLWIPTYSSGIYRMNPETFETEHFQQRSNVEGSPVFTGISAFLHYAKNQVWLAGDDRIIAIHLDTGRIETLFSLPPNSGYVRTMMLHNNQLYIGTSEGLLRLNRRTGQTEIIDFLPAGSRKPEQSNVKTLFYEAEIGLIIGSVNGLYRLSNAALEANTETTPPTADVLLTDFNIWDIDRVAGQYYLSTNNGLYTYDFNDQHAEFVLKFSNSSFYTNDDNILDLYVDKNQTLWMSSRTQGVLRWSQNIGKFQHLTQSTQPALSNEVVEPLYQDQNNHLWIGTSNGLNRYDLSTHTITQYLTENQHHSISGMHVVSFLFPDSEHAERFWIVTDQGLFSFDTLTGELMPPKMSDNAKRILQSQWIYNFYLHDNQNAFLLNNAGHFHFNTATGDITELKALNEQINITDSKAFLGFLPNRPQELVVASSTHIFLYHLQNNTLQTIYTIENYIPDLLFHVEPGQVDQDNVLWFTIAGEGLIGLDAQTFEIKYQFDGNTELTNNQLYSLEIDQYNNLWIGSTNGLFRLDDKRLHAEHYVVEDGLISREFGRSSSLKLQNNQLAFGTQLGLTLFDPSDFIAAQTQQDTVALRNLNYQVHLSEARVLQENGEAQGSISSTNNRVELQYDQAGLYLNYSTLDFQQQSRTFYHIELRGSTQVQLSNYPSNELLLPRLDAGNYQLTIRARHPIDGIESQPLRLNIKVHHWPWLSPFAQFVYAVLLFMAILIYTIIRRNKANEFKRLHRKLKESLHRMQMALESNNSGIWEYDVEQDVLYEERLADDLGYDDIGYATSMSQHISLLGPEYTRRFMHSWQTFVNGEQNDWIFTYPMLSADGKVLWYRDTAKIVERNVFGNVRRISGTYTNITERKATEELSRVFGQAFSQINDWVLIFDNELRPVTANTALTEMLKEYSDIDRPLLRQLIHRVGADNARRYRDIMLSLAPHEHWQGEDYLNRNTYPHDSDIIPITAVGDQRRPRSTNNNFPISVKIHSIGSDPYRISHYVVIISDITVQKTAEKKLRYMAHYDFLTDLPNRKLLLEKIREKIERYDNQFAVLFIDLDKFKQVNDLYGHYVGDKLLRTVARILANNVGSRDLVARQSGDEFIILLDSYESTNDIALIAKSILSTFARPVILDDLHVTVTASIGIAIYPDDANDADALISKADLAMIHAKRQARGDFQFFTQVMNEEALARMTLENDLKRAVIKNEFLNYYQPIVNSHTDTIVGAELLLRWNNGDTPISPGVFIPICEEIGIISQMTINAIDRALHDYRKWFIQHRQFYISINLSPVHILQEGLTETLMQLLDKHQLCASVLRLEITESTLLSDVDVAVRRLEELRALGFKLLLDDFGTGYSSMGYLSRFSIDYIKIDKSFVLNLESQTNRSIISSVVTLADNLSLKCIVEGVETQQQREYMESLGCKLLQGYYYSRPVPAPDIVDQEIFKEAVC